MSRRGGGARLRKWLPPAPSSPRPGLALLCPSVGGLLALTPPPPPCPPCPTLLAPGLSRSGPQTSLPPALCHLAQTLQDLSPRLLSLSSRGTGETEPAHLSPMQAAPGTDDTESGTEKLIYRQSRSLFRLPFRTSIRASFPRPAPTPCLRARPPPSSCPWC